MKTKQEVGLEFIKHHGVKGMHWGVRNPEKKAARQDRKFIRQTQTTKIWIKVHNGAIPHFSKGIVAINNKPEYKDKNLYAHPDLLKKYDREAHALLEESFRKSASSIISKSGRLQYVAITDKTGNFEVGVKEVSHASVPGAIPTAHFIVVRDSNGKITKITVDATVNHTVSVDDILKHHGVKGMHWGVRREQLRTSSATKRGAKEVQRRLNRTPSPVRVTDTIGSSSVSKTKLKAVGGEDHPAHEDAIKVAAARQKMKKSGIHTLSNEELQKMAARMNLESQVHSLNSRRKKSIGQGFVDAHLAKAQKDPFGTVMKVHKITQQAPKVTQHVPKTESFKVGFG